MDGFKNIRKGAFGRFEDPKGKDRFYIEVVEKMPAEDGSEDKYMLLTYGDLEETMMEKDYQTIIDVLDQPIAEKE
ncbi:hypothetical protein BH11BAC1_BH11BAC1_10510 [soil metagenome]